MQKLHASSYHYGSGFGLPCRHSRIGRQVTARPASVPATTAAICARSRRYPESLGSGREALLVRTSDSGRSSGRGTSTSPAAVRQGRSRGPYLLGDHTLPTKQAVNNLIQTILHAYGLGDVVRPDDARCLADLLSQHPAAAAKVGCGVSHFEVREPPVDDPRNYFNVPRAQDRCFWLVRTDGTSSDWSYRKCVDMLGRGGGSGSGVRGSGSSGIGGAAATAAVAVVTARHAREDLRAFVKEQTESFRRANTLPGGMVRCEATCEVVASVKAHVDHEAPVTFRALVQGWLREEGLADENQVDFENAEMMGRWARYHRKHAVLRMVVASVNLSRQ